MLARAISGSKLLQLPFPQAPGGGVCTCKNVISSGGTKSISSSPVLYKSKIEIRSTMREGRMFKNMVSGGGKKTRKQFSFNQPASNQLKDFSFLSKGTEGKGKSMSGRVKRRIDVLNNLFVEQITSLLATGEVSPEFVGLGLQISKVKTLPDFSGVNVYWYATGSEKDERIDELLQKTSGHLRHVLSQLRVIGVVPPINFHKDKTYSKLSEVEYLLAKCDFGPDFESSTSIYNVNNSKPEIQDQTSSNSTTPEVQLTMRQDTLGVKHDLIMNEIMKGIQKKKDRQLARENQATGPRSISDVGYHEPMPEHDKNDSLGQGEVPKTALEIEVENHRKRQHEFLQYLKKRRAEKEKLLKLGSTDAAERSFVLSQKDERYQIQLEGRLKELDEEGKHDDDVKDDEDEYYADEQEYYNRQREHFKYE